MTAVMLDPLKSSSSWITGGTENGGTSVKSLKLSRYKRQNVERGGKKMAIVSRARRLNMASLVAQW